MHQQAALRAPRRPPVPVRLLRLASDERLVEQVRGGSKQAFEVLFDRHHRVVLAFCRHMLGSPEEAEDAVQHTFLAAYRDLVRSDKPIALRAWLFAIARNRCLSMLRARREQPLDEAPEPSTEHLSAAVQRREDLRVLLHDLAALPDDQRAALVLAEVGDVSHDEIAQVLGCPREKVKALVFQARSSLQASRAARETSCEEIREQLASARGGALRKTNLRRHLRECPGCQAFKAEVAAQRKALALVLPVAPTLGLKRAVLGSVFGGGGGSGAAAAGTGAAAAGGVVSAAPGGALVAKALVVAAVAGGGAIADVAVTHHGAARPTVSAPAAAAGGVSPAAHRESRGARAAAAAHGSATSGAVAVTGDAPAGEAVRSEGAPAAAHDHAGTRHRGHHRHGHGARAGGRGDVAGQAPSGHRGGNGGGRSTGGRAGAGRGRGGSNGGGSSGRGASGSSNRGGGSTSRGGSAGNGTRGSSVHGSGSSAGGGPAATRDVGSLTRARNKPVKQPALRTVAGPAATPTGIAPTDAHRGSSSG